MSEVEEVERLRRRLKEAREAYFNLSPIMPDPEYDVLRDRLRALAPGDFEVTAVGASPPKLSTWEKVEHRIPMGSLSKVNSKEEFIEWANGVGTTKSTAGEPPEEDAAHEEKIEWFRRRNPLLFTLKVDGSSMELVYEKGELIRCVTRGNGKVGEDVTTNISRVPSVPKKLLVPMSMTVRGEIVMMKAVFEERYAKEYANPRNTAAGKVRDTKATDEDCNNLTFLAYSLICEEDHSPVPGTENGRFTLLESNKFQTPEYGTGDVEDAAAYHEILACGRRQQVPYEIDGTVIRLNDILTQEELGDNNMRPRGQIAYKFDAATGVTRVLDVRWQVGPTGRITPVASVEPVDIGGVTITSVSLHNMTMFRELGLFPQCKVLVSRRNDVIPYIESRVED